MLTTKTVNWFSKIATVEGISFLLLLFIAMPLKYFAGLPQAVKMVGWAHGVLFVAFLIMACMVKVELKKSFFWLMKAFAASVFPFGTFWLNGQMKRDGDFLRKVE